MSRAVHRTNTRRADTAAVAKHRRAVLARIVRGCGIVLAIGVAGAGAMLLNEQLRITAWNIDVNGGNTVALQRQIDTVMQSLPDYDFWSTRPSALRERLLADVADLERIEISRTMIGSLHLIATPRTPVALWQNAEGDILLVDAHGKAYRKLEASEKADLPLFRMSASDIASATELIRALQASKPEFYAAVSELLGDGNNWKINFSHGQQWILPRSRNISYAINRVGNLLDNPRWRAGHWRVDARASTRWFIRPARQQGVI